MNNQNSKKRKSDDGEAVFVPKVVPKTNFTSNGEIIDQSTSISDALLLENLTLNVGEETFNCIVNPPRIKGLSLTAQPMAGMLLYADLTSPDTETGMSYEDRAFFRGNFSIFSQTIITLPVKIFIKLIHG